MVPKVTLVVLNWNNAEDTLRCLASLAQLTYSNYEVIVVDNGSTDDSVLQIRSAYDRTILIETGENLGYAGGNNLGIRYALEQGTEYVCILNNDVIVAPDFLEPLMFELRTNPGVGVVTPLIADMNDSAHVWTLGAMIMQQTGAVTRLFTGQKVELVQTKMPFEVDVAPGSTMLVRCEVFDVVGLFSEDFYLYYEESDWSLLVRKSDYSIYAVPASIVWHKGSAALGRASPIIDYYMLRNHMLFIMRHWSGIEKRLLLSRVVLRNSMCIVAYTLKPHQGHRLLCRDARLVALRDALLGHWGKMGSDAAAICYRKGR